MNSEKNCSTTTAIANPSSDINSIWEEKKSALGLFIDLQKAFDTLDWETLLQKLKEMNICGRAMDCIKNYLTDRLQYLEIEHQHNNKHKIIIQKNT